jgi:two-component system chemotaxis sensor kinase CheA
VSDANPADICFTEFLDDYFVECEEHLAVARRGLLSLDAFVGNKPPDRSLLDELFRSFHSLKGLSAMVAVREAERLAHEMESYLSGLTKGRILLSTEGLDALVEGVKSLEQVIAARRDGAPPPHVDRLIARLAALVPDDKRELATAAPPQAASRFIELAAEKTALLKAALQGGARAWRFTFTPSPALAERGVNVNTVRQRLQAAGELIHAAPQVLGEGRVVFSFLVVSQADESTFRAWQSDGLSYAPEAPPESPPNPADEASPLPRPARPIMPSNIVRVDLGRLDDLMRQIGELVISRARLDDTVKRLAAKLPAPDWRGLQETNQAIERQLRDLRGGVMRVRLVPVREVFARMQFVVHDLARESGKKIALELSGQETEIDKLIVERMMDPLLHLVRNAVSHGLEMPAERLAAGKPPEGKLVLRAYTTGETIVIEVEDDGRGLDAEAVFAKARRAGLHPVAGTDAASLLDVICAPGFSTRDEADRASGRGIGMSVARGVAEELGGSLALDTKPGYGTRFTIRLPLTLSIADALIVEVGGQTYAIPQVSVREVVHIHPENVTVLENNELISHHDGVLPLLRLAWFFGLENRTERAFTALVVGAGLGAVGLAVDRVLGLREIVVRPLTDAVIRVSGIAGATELGDGRAVLILDAPTLTRAARKLAGAKLSAASAMDVVPYVIAK